MIKSKEMQKNIYLALDKIKEKLSLNLQVPLPLGEGEKEKVITKEKLG
jgi:hypothetical protein